MGVPKQRTAGVFHHFSTIFARKKRGCFPDFRLVFVGLYRILLGFQGPFVQALMDFFQRNGTHPGVQGIIFPGWSTEECNKMDQCRNCLSGHGCWSIDTWTGYGVSSYGDWTKIDSPNIFSNLPRNHGFLWFFDVFCMAFQNPETI